MIIFFLCDKQRSLIETQKIELHSKALKYLQRHTRRCMACGELQFAKLLGRTITQERNKSSSHQIFDGTQIEVAPFKETSENGIVHQSI